MGFEKWKRQELAEKKRKNELLSTGITLGCLAIVNFAIFIIAIIVAVQAAKVKEMTDIKIESVN